MSRPRLLDLFCGAGGCAAGYARAGFEVHGVDVRPQPRYLASGAASFTQADALEYVAAHGAGFDAIHASPPCQAYSKGAGKAGSRERHPDLVGPCRKLLQASGRPWVIENVEQAATTRRVLSAGVVLCGTMFDLGVFRHRAFESSLLLWCPPHARHTGRVGDGRFVTCAGNAGGSSRRDGWKNGGTDAWRAAMGIGWMTMRELSQAIPPAYCEFIGRQLMGVVQGARA